MNNFLKTIITGFGVVAIIGIIFGITKAFNGNYAFNSPLGFICILLIAAAMIYYIGYAIKEMWVMSLFLIVVFLQSCNYAKSNQQVVISDDCGMSWKKINAGDAVPTGGVNACYMKVVIPNYPMQGDSRFITNLKDRVRASVHIDYDYSITEPLAFIKQAKYLGKANATADSNEALDNSAFEGAENMVIDKRIRDVSKSMFLKEDIVDMDQAELENNLLDASNKSLEPFGVHLNFITLTFDLDEQTRQAIDVSTAMKVYESKGIKEVGERVIIQRAGANKITVENKTETVQSEK